MPAHFVHSTHPRSYDPPRKYVLVLSCVDARLLDDLVGFLDHDNLTNRYYHVTLPGTSLGLTTRWERDQPGQHKKSGQATVDNPTPGFEFNLSEQFARWRQTFIDQVQAAIILTEGDITDIYIVQHEDCGAFRAYIKKDSSEMSAIDELELHREYAQALLTDIADRFYVTYNPKDSAGNFAQDKMPILHSFYMDLRGHVTHLSTYTDQRTSSKQAPLTEESVQETSESTRKVSRKRRRADKSA